MGFPRQEYWSGLPFPSLEDLPNPGIKPASPVSPALAGGFFTTEPAGNPNTTPGGGKIASCGWGRGTKSGLFLFCIKHKWTHSI